MSVLTPFKKQEQTKVPNSSYIRTENKPEEAEKPVEPAKPTQTEAE